VQNVEKAPDRPRMSTLCIHAMHNVERAGLEAEKSTFCTQTSRYRRPAADLDVCAL
jgi:hypothetical protein